ncbi:acyl carrier protein [Dyadobacter sp. BE34]|jgi:acyl carrier protein|uniref:Acyl carrier protein n=3 Tax=Dyadobacter TaxID=120831 RepID=A0A2P8G1D9_9BACT|nr:MULTISPECIES: phosphopantetheine-binding protein [Dyadobacter]PSL27802.1 acyl carrier protein [Dyadobacter jiangsuensis]MBO9611523.1 acyl carrier protein [Dyadobacter sp.]MDR6808763.1 acyl carrier protein [Dyadobacter fermentans]MDR7046506.1 acyl carrier protein [Dyadobacter sp. BE242]MDR7200819.1 acyl carrier protein [Dyadobacter sp. BE34]
MYANDVKMSLEEVIEETRDFLSEEFEVDRDLILPENSLKDTLDLDSLDYVDLVVLIDENLNIKLTGEDFKGIETFGDFYQLVGKKLAL